jgi:hypothetical protein
LKNSNGSHRHIPSDDQINQSQDAKNSQIHKIGEQNVDMGYHRSQTNPNIQHSNTGSQNNLKSSMGYPNPTKWLKARFLRNTPK